MDSFLYKVDRTKSKGKIICLLDTRTKIDMDLNLNLIVTLSYSKGKMWAKELGDHSVAYSLSKEDYNFIRENFG